MRSSNLPASIVASTTPDMFKSRRSSHLVLMQDDRDRLGRKVSGPRKGAIVNESKPYAGVGGMKKLLARRKLELEEEGEENDQSKDTSSISVPLHSVPDSDSFPTVASAPGERSLNLRVGRSQTFRSHPRPYKANFSAKFDEEPDDTSEKANYHSQTQREMLKEAAKKVPSTELPTDFSFAKNSTAVDGMEEVPTTLLPFPLLKSSSPASESESASKRADSSMASSTLEVPAAVPIRIPTPEPKVSSSAPSKAPPGFSLAPGPPLVPPAGGIPTFFASSLPKDSPPAAPVSNLTSSRSSTATVPLAAPSAFSLTAPSTQPVNDLENPFWDGDKKTGEEASKPPQSVFDKVSTRESANAATPTPPPLFGGVTSAFPAFPAVDTASSTSTGFSFAKLSQEGDAKESSAEAPEPPKLPFSFGTSSNQKRPEIETIAPKALASNTTSTLFGDSSKPGLFEPPKASPFGTTGPPQSTPSPLPFSFGSNTSQNAAATAAPSQSTLFGLTPTTATTADTPKSIFGNSGAFSFASEPVQKAKEVKTAPAPFSFGATLSSPLTVPVAVSKPAPAPVFSFDQASTNASSSVAPIAFSFGGGGSATADVSSKQPFMFGQTNPIAPTARPVTPPKNSDNEFRMEESPTREMQQNGNGKLAETRPSLGGFSFGTNNSDSNAGSSLFGGGNSSTGAPLSTPFSFGGSSLANPFAPKNPQSEESKGFAGFGQTAPVPPTISTTFSFGQQLKSPENAQRPSTTGPFSFAATPTSATSATPAFSFSGSTNSNPFGQPAPGSAPSSPSTFNQPSFAFGGPTTTAGGAFAFGSQPASPAGGANLTLPQSSFGTGGGFGQSAPQQPSSPFNSPIALAPSTSSGGSLFTMGSAPAPAPGARQIKKLPNRRVVKR
ncbi:hypothetical protein M413DRAFT_92894 [Hebeloma cylindrosporum]|uniref:Uncharacterized protein n=1 Tax=Hebeloma cylindrosporum TaxID=76867 RepID=A0A0C3CJX4_HEBCY|nr:hypothetical protein M413DRAFT_92894 [Hebeloma cylindrosporum h7]